MSLVSEIKSAHLERKTIADQAGAILSAANRSKRQLTSEEVQEFEKRHAEVDALGTRIGLLEKQHEVEMEMGAIPRDNRMAGRENIDSRNSQYQSAGYERRDLPPGGTGSLTTRERETFFRWMKGDGPSELRSLTVGSPTGGGDTVPQLFINNMEIALKWYGGIISVCDNMPTETGAQTLYPTVNDTAQSAEVIAENAVVMGGSGGASQTNPTFGVITFNAYMIDTGIIEVTFQLLGDNAVGLEDALTKPNGGLLPTRIMRKLNQLATIGTGSGQPMGVVTAATIGKTGASPTTVSYNELLDLKYSVDINYRQNAKWMFHDITQKAIRKLTDGNSRPLWIAGGVSEGIQNKAPDTLDGDPVVVNNDMAQLGSSAKSLLFGDFSKFKIRRVKEMNLRRLDERYIENLNVGFIAWLRADSQLVDAGTAPVRFFQNSAT